MFCDHHAGLFQLVHVRWHTHMAEGEKRDWEVNIAGQCPRCCGRTEDRHVPRDLAHD